MGRRSRALIAGLTIAVAGLAVSSCGNSPVSSTEGTVPSEPDLLFVGNSLTYTNNLPAVVAAIAEELGRPVTYATLANPNWSLEDHWQAGLANEIRTIRPKLVILQQGPSTLASSRAHLVAWSERIAGEVAGIGGEVALLGVWSAQNRLAFFPDGAASYAAAARASNGYYIPAAETWLAAWAEDPTLPLYGGDGFHPGYLGTLAAAYSTVALLLDVDPDDLPALSDGVSPEIRDILKRAVATTSESAFGPR